MADACRCSRLPWVRRTLSAPRWDTILLIEDVNTPPYQIDRMLMQLKLAGKLSGVRGIVFGEMPGCVPPPATSPYGYALTDVLRRLVGELGVPVAFGLNAGHVSADYGERQNLTLALGLQASLVVEGKHAELAVLEPATGAA